MENPIFASHFNNNFNNGKTRLTINFFIIKNPKKKFNIKL